MFQDIPLDLLMVVIHKRVVCLGYQVSHYYKKSWLCARSLASASRTTSASVGRCRDGERLDAAILELAELVLGGATCRELLCWYRC